MLPSRILIVEDEAIVALDLADRLAAFGYEIIGTAADGAIAQELVRTKSPDLILMDIQIRGDIDGIETAERIRLRHDIPIIFLTANSDEQTVRRAKITGPFGYLLKPFEERELHTTIEMALYRHQLEQKVRESEHWLNTTLRCIGDGVIATDNTGKIKFINSIAERITGWSAADACGQEIERVFNIIAEGDNSPMTSPVRTALATREIVLLKNHTLLIRKDGIRLPIDDSSAPIIDNTNEIVGAVLVFRDVTERVKAEKAILVSEQRYNDLFNSVREGIGVTNEHEVIEFCNPALLQIFDEQTLQDVVGRTFLRYIPEDQLSIFNTHLDTRKAGVFSQFEIDIVTQKGVRKSILISTSPRLDENGIYRGTFCSILDITARRMAEEKLKEYQNQLEDLVLQRTAELEKAYNTLQNEIVERKKLEEQRREMEEKLHRAEKMESLGLLAGGVAHDLNNMLGPLVAYPELILNKLPNDSPVRKMVERISNSANDAANVIQDLLTLARRGRYELHPVNLNRVVESYLDSPAFLRLQSDRPEIVLSTKLYSSSLYLNGSATHLGKVIMNLVVNAYDAIDGSGQVSIITDIDELTALSSGFSHIEPGKYVVLNVIDNGCGIEAVDVPKIFEPYYSKKKMGKSGTGLGLSVVYGVIKDHNSYYDIITEPGRGTEFKLYFPATANDPQKVENKAIGSIKGCEKLLVVDDCPNQAEMAREILTTYGYNVHTAKSGGEAIEMVKRNKYDLLLLDMIMDNGFDGLDTYIRVKKIQKDQKAIVISGYSSTERVDMLLKLGAGCYLKKPYTSKQLAEAVRKELDKAISEKTHFAPFLPPTDLLRSSEPVT